MKRIRIKWRQCGAATRLAVLGAALILVPLCGYVFAQVSGFSGFAESIATLADGDSFGADDADDSNQAKSVLASVIKTYTSSAPTFTGLHKLSVTSGITASTTQSQGQGALTQAINQVSTCATANDTVTLPTAVAGEFCLIINDGAETLQVFPASSDDLGAGVNTSTTITAGSWKAFQAYDATNWEDVSGGGIVTSGSNNQLLTDDGAGGITSEANLTFDGTTLTLPDGISITSPGGGTNSEEFGAGADTASANDAVALGSGALADTAGEIAIGKGAVGGGVDGIAIGNVAVNTSSISLAIGRGANAGHEGIALGHQSSAATGQLVTGSNNLNIDNVYIDEGVTNATPNGVTYHATGGSGTDITGGDFTIAGGIGTGTGLGGNVKLQTADVGTTGTSLNTLVDRHIVVGEAYALTDAATSLFAIALADGETTGGVIQATIKADDGSDHQSLTQTVTYAAVNSGDGMSDSYTSDFDITGESTAVSAGTLTATWGVSTGSDTVTVQVTPTGSLTETTYTIMFTLTNNSHQAITLQ